MCTRWAPFLSISSPDRRAEADALANEPISEKPFMVSLRIADKVGSHAKDDWEMKLEGPAGFERSYTLAGGAGEHQPAAIGSLVAKLLPAR